MRLLAIRSFRRLLATRFAAQWGDGLFQASIGGAVLFNPERQADPAAIAVGLAVLLLPYSVIGPFAGALLDRWDRRRVLLVANLLRGVAIALTALAVGSGMDGIPLYAGALLVTGVSRFVNAGLSASLPHVVDRAHLVEANALSTTLGAAIAVIGSGCAIGLREIFGPHNAGSALVTSTAMIGSLVAAVVAARFRSSELGPDEFDEPAQTMVAVARGLADGARAAAHAPTVAAGFIAMVAHRLAFGAALLMGVLLMRYTFHDTGPLRAGFAGIGEAAAAGGIGLVLAAVLTSRLVARFGRCRAMVGALIAAGAAQLLLAAITTLPTALVSTLVIVSAGQVVKLCLDASVQCDVGDAVRGRVFALYDTLFNLAQVVAVAVAAVVIPMDGNSPTLMLVVAMTYLLGAVGFLAVERRVTRNVDALLTSPGD